MDDDDLTGQLDAFLTEVLDAGEVPNVPVFLGEEWEPLAEQVADLLTRFEQTMVIEVTRPDGAECYIQFAREDHDIRAELVGNEFLGARALAPDRVSVLVDLGWDLPGGEYGPNFSRLFVGHEPRHLAWAALQTLHEVYDAEADHTWAVMPPELVDAEGTFPHDESTPIVEPWEIAVVAEGPDDGVEQRAAEEPSDQQIRAVFQLPKAVTILGRSSSVTNSFVNSIIPVLIPTTEEIKRALSILGMSDAVACSYCGDPWTEWDHLRPIVIDQQPTGYVHEIHNLVPACGKCNQSKGNKPWREWMFGDAAKSPKTRGIPDIEQRAARLQAYEEWQAPTKLDLAQIVGAEEWRDYWQRWKDLMVQMRAATEHAAAIRALVAKTQSPGAEFGTLPFEDADTDTAPASAGPGWIVRGPQGTAGPMRKNRAVLETVRALVAAGVTPESLVSLLGSSHFRSVDGTLAGDLLWNAFAQQHQRTHGQRRLWFLDAPIHDGDRTWVLANNVWGRQTYHLFKDLVTCSNGTVTVTQPNGVDVKHHDTGEGMRVLKPGEPVPAKKPVPSRRAGRWSGQDQEILDLLAVAEARWAAIQPTDGFGSATLATAAALAERGFDVWPIDVDDLADEELAALEPASLLAVNGTRRIAVFTNDFGQPDRDRWARLKERVGPYSESPALDRALADFSVHGPFERDVCRHDGQVWVTVSVRLGDLDTALLDLINVASGLNSALRSVGSAD